MGQYTKDQLIALFTKQMGEPFWDEPTCDFEFAMLEWLQMEGIEMEEDALQEEKDERQIKEESDGTIVTSELYFFDIDVLVRVSARLNDYQKWEFSIEKIEEVSETSGHSFLTSYETIEVNGVLSVLAVYNSAPSGTKVYAVPLDVAQRIGLSQYDGKEFHNYTEDKLLQLISEYELDYGVSFYNYD